MTNPVDLSRLRQLTGGDSEVEKQLFELFINSAEESISNMENNCTDGANKKWRDAAHALKGSSLNTGAQELSNTCCNAQERHDAPAKDKKDMLLAIKVSLDDVKDFLSKEH